jgi:CheY-like chemotaxis protein
MEHNVNLDYPLEGLRILIVEDFVDTGIVLTRRFYRAGAAVAEIRTSYLQAQNCLQQQTFDVVLIDHNLIGNRTGLDLAIWLRDQPEHRSTIRISFSGSDPMVVQSQLPDDGVYHDLITKPISFDNLVKGISEIVARHRAT